MTRVICLVYAVALWSGFRNIHFGTAFSSHDMVRLRNDLLSNYSVGVLPLRNQSTSLSVNMSFFLIMIHNLNMKNQIMTASGWLKFEWCDEFLQWSPDVYGGIDEIILFQKDVWLPDIFVENTAQHYRELGNNQMLISVKSSGMVHWEPGIITETSCAVNIGKYPFDTQICDIRFLTWMHTNKTLTVAPESDVIHLDPMLPNGEWDITRTEANVYRYPSTYRPGTDHTGVTFVVHLRRKRFFYVLNTIIPVVMLSCLNVLVFILPSDCGERMALAVTVLLAFTVYLGIISDNIPKTSESLSLLAIYLTSLLALSTASVVCAGIVLNIHYRDPSLPVPKLLKWMFSPVSWRDEPAKVAPSTCRPERRPSVWTRRLTLRDSRTASNKDYRPEDKHEDREDGGCESEKQVFISTVTSPTKKHSATVYTDVNNRESWRQPGHGDDSVDSSTDQRHIWQRADSNNMKGRQPSPDSKLGNHITAGKHISYDSLPFLEREFTLNSRQHSQPEDHDVELSVSKRKIRPHDTPRRCTSDLRNHYSSSSVAKPEVHRHLSEDDKDRQPIENDNEITWHDIGNSLDRSLFWVFFLVTNTVTVIIMVLFVMNDA